MSARKNSRRAIRFENRLGWALAEMKKRDSWGDVAPLPRFSDSQLRQMKRAARKIAAGG